MNRFVVLTALLTAFVPGTARAWNATGHSVVALIAYRELSEKDQKQVQTILKDHPQFEMFLTKNVPANANRDEWIVMQASVWPDWIKGAPSAIKSKYNRPDWHYVNLPIRMLDGATDDQRKAIEANIADTTKKRGQILGMIPNAMAGLKDARSTRQEQAVHLCWMLHLIGDLHQPLHAAAYFTRDSLDGDAGGNLFFVRKGSQPARLHGIWDDALGQFQAFPVLDELARVAKKQPVTAEERAVTDPKKWAEESQQIATKVAYRNGTDPLKGELVADFNAKSSDQPPPLPEGYEAKLRAVSRQRVALAGVRLADAIKASLPETK